MTDRTVTISKRFLGPPASANGGYACGTTALFLGDGPVEASLRVPPPVEKPLRAEVDADRAALFDGDAMVAEARRTDVDLALPDPVRFDEAARAAAGFDLGDYLANHPFPGCFTCGPARDEGDGLRLFPSVIDRADPVVAIPWVPDASLTADDGLVDGAVVWAALDCPSAFGASLAREADEYAANPAVLGRMHTLIERRPAPGERLVAGAWPIGRDGRKWFAGSVVWAEDGSALAHTRATWITLSDEQVASFGATRVQEASPEDD